MTEKVIQKAVVGVYHSPTETCFLTAERKMKDKVTVVEAGDGNVNCTTYDEKTKKNTTIDAGCTETKSEEGNVVYACCCMTDYCNELPSFMMSEAKGEFKSPADFGRYKGNGDNKDKDSLGVEGPDGTIIKDGKKCKLVCEE